MEKKNKNIITRNITILYEEKFDKLENYFN